LKEVVERKEGEFSQIKGSRISSFDCTVEVARKSNGERRGSDIGKRKIGMKVLQEGGGEAYSKT